MHPLRRDSCNHVFSSSQAAVSFCFRFSDNLVRSSGESRMKSCSSCGRWSVDRSPLCLLLGDLSVVMPIIVERVLGGVIDDCFRLPHDIDVFSWEGEGCFARDVQLCKEKSPLITPMSPYRFLVRKGYPPHHVDLHQLNGECFFIRHVQC